MRRDRGVWRFALFTLAWLAPCFAAWYWLAPYHARPTGWLAYHFIRLYKQGLVVAFDLQERMLVFDTSIVIQQPDGAAVRVLVESNPLLYSYGLAFFLALMLASRARPWYIVGGLVAILPFQAWGVAFDVLTQAGIKMGWEVTERAGIFGWRREVAALGYQMGTLIFPVLVPVVLWGSIQRDFIRRLIAPDANSGLASGMPVE